MKRKLATLVAVAGLAIGLGATSAAAAPPAGAGDGGKPAGIVCQQAGITTLQSLDLLAAVAKDGIPVAGVGTTSFPEVLRLHRDMPSLFQTGGVSVVVGESVVPATWCNPAPAA